MGALGGTMLGVILDLCGILFSTSGNLLIRWVANRDEKRLIRNPDYKKPKEYLDPLWYLIVILLFGNGAIDFAAFQFATMMILAPLASVSIVLNSIVAYFLLGEKFTFLHGVGSCIMICGATLTIIYGPQEKDIVIDVYVVWDYFKSPSYLIFEAIKISLLGCCVAYIHFVPVVELEKHPTKKAAERAATLAASSSKASPTIEMTNIVRLHEEGPSPVVTVQGDELTLRTSHESVGPGSTPSTDESRSRQSSANPPQEDLARIQCQCPTTPRDDSSQPTTPTRPLNGQLGLDIPSSGPLIRRPVWQRFLYTQGHIVIWAFLVSGVGSYTNLTGKIFVKLIGTSANGYMQFTHWGAYLVAVLLIAAAVTQLHLMKVSLARFESIVIMPSLNCMYILHLMCEGGMFFSEFNDFPDNLAKGLFALSIVIAFIGIAVASSVKEQSLDAKPEKSPLATELDILVSAPKTSSNSAIPV